MRFLFCLVLSFGTGALPVLAASSPPHAGQALFWQDTWRGWHFYEAPPGEDDAEPPPSTNATAEKESALAAFARLQKTLEEYKNTAIIHPTEANVRRYLQLEALTVAQSSYFADVAQRIAWASPELDPALSARPVNAKALDVFEHNQAEDRATTLSGLARDHTVLFFFRSDCPYCHAYAPTLRALEANHGLRVVAISLDGGPLPDFPSPRLDNGIARALQVSNVPATFLAEPATGKVTPVGFGVLSESELLERMAAVANPDADTLTPSLRRQLPLR